MYDSYFIASSNIQMPKQKSLVYFIPQISPNNQGELVTGISPEVNHRKWWCCRPTFSPHEVDQQDLSERKGKKKAFLFSYSILMF